VAKGIVAGILESEHHPGADPANGPVGGGVRVVVTTEPWSIYQHVQPFERLFVIPDLWVEVPPPYGLWPWTVGAAEIHVATSIWPERLKRWGTWEAEKYFRERVLPLMQGRENRPSNWWMRPGDWVLD
jgi:hypothetical protein